LMARPGMEAPPKDLDEILLKIKAERRTSQLRS